MTPADLLAEFLRLFRAAIDDLVRRVERLNRTILLSMPAEGTA